MKTTETKTHQTSQAQIPKMYQNVDKLERENYAGTLIDEYVAFAGKREFRDLIRNMSYLELVNDSKRQPSLASR